MIVSENSWPFTIVTPSRLPADPFTKFCPQLAPASVTYGMLVNAMSPYGEEAAPPVNVASPL